MSQEVLYHTIEQYLAGNLDADALATFEQRLSNEPDLVEEVEVHRKMQEALENPVKLKLRANLDQLRKEFTIAETSPVALSQKTLWRNPWIIAASILGIGALLWLLVPKSPVDQSIVAETPSVEKEIPKDEVDEKVNTTIDEEIEPQREAAAEVDAKEMPKLKTPSTIAEKAMPNPFFEKLIKEYVRVKGYDIGIEGPVQDDIFTRTESFVDFRVNGTLETSDSKINDNLIVAIFNHQSSTIDLMQSVIYFPLDLQKEVDGDEEDGGLAFAAKELYFFDTIKKIDLVSGIYYYALISKTIDAPLYIARFKVSD